MKADDRLSDKGLTSVYLKSIEGFQDCLKCLFPEKKLEVVEGSLGAGKRNLAAEGRQIAYPFFTMQIAGSDLNREGYNIKALQRQGRAMVDSHDQNSFRAQHLVPTILDLRVQFFTNRYIDVYTFDQRWKIAAVQNLFQLWIKPAGLKQVGDDSTLSIHIRTVLSEQIQIPEPAADEDGKDKEYMVEATAQMRTYVGNVAAGSRVVGHVINLNVFQGQNAGISRKSDVISVTTPVAGS